MKVKLAVSYTIQYDNYSFSIASPISIVELPGKKIQSWPFPIMEIDFDDLEQAINSLNQYKEQEDKDNKNEQV